MEFRRLDQPANSSQARPRDDRRTRGPLSFVSWLSGRSGRSDARRPVELIAALNDVAAAVSSTISLDEVLATIVDRAKWITNTEKAIIVLTVDHSDTLDRETLVVRGSRGEHPEEWWLQRLEDSAVSVFARRTIMLERDAANGAWMITAPIQAKERSIGVLAAINSLDNEFTDEQADFISVLSAFAASAIENARLAEESKYVLLSSERDRIAREMHDGISQSLFSVALGLEVCRKQIARDPVGVGARLEELQQMVDTSRSELRRFIYDLRPVKLQELGLSGAIEYWIREVTAGETVQARFVVHGERRNLTPAVESCLYRVAKEAVGNVMRHANASSFEVALTYEPACVVMSVTDDGSGFDLDSAVRRSEQGSSLGMRSMRERVTRERGKLSITTTPGEGTTVRAELPV